MLFQCVPHCSLRDTIKLSLSLTLFVCIKAFADSVSSQKRAAADGECREENLLQETATKEAAMATRIEEVQAELKQARLALGNAHAEIDRLGVFSSQLKKVSDSISEPAYWRYTLCYQAPSCHDTYDETKSLEHISCFASFPK